MWQLHISRLTLAKVGGGPWDRHPTYLTPFAATYRKGELRACMSMALSIKVWGSYGVLQKKAHIVA